MPSRTTAADLVCLSHLRWDSVFQRPQHLMSRFARERRVFFVEEPVPGEREACDVRTSREGVTVVTPRLPASSPAEAIAAQRRRLDAVLRDLAIERFHLWYYTPMALLFTRHLAPERLAYDCMDELSAFAGAPPELLTLEAELFRRAQVVFTGGHSLYEHKRGRHPNLHAVPSAVELSHFATARAALPDPADQATIPRPRLGFIGVIDERFDVELLREVARLRPELQFVLVGPVLKIDPASLPRGPNLHYLGPKRYDELPAYLSNWDVALLPFARNEATRFISPTKTPEYLAAGKPVVSTPIRDVVRPYGEGGLVEIAERPEEFVRAIDVALATERVGWLRRVDALLAGISWDRTWARMRSLLEGEAAAKASTN